MNRRELMVGAGAVGGLALGGCARAQAPAGPDPLLGASLMRDVSTYTAFGIHRSGSSGDIATSSWFADRWTALGYKVEQPEFETPNCDTYRAQVEIGGQTIGGFAQPPVTNTPEGGLRGVLAEWNEAFPSNVAGRIAVVHVPGEVTNPAGPAYRAAFAKAAAAGAIGIVGAIATVSDEIAAINTPIDMKFGTPVLTVGEAAKPFLDTAVQNQALALLRIEGPGGTRTAKNTIATHGTRGPWLIVSTPQSGWFKCGGERGPGIAMSLALADWVLRQNFPNRILFIATSGHEWTDAGAHIFHAKGAPDPKDTAFWLHLGASFGARAYEIGDKSMKPLDTPNPTRTFMVSRDLMEDAMAAFAGQPGISNPTPSSVERSAGELTAVIKEGYASHAGFFGAHALFHTPFDDETATTPEIMEPIARACAKLIEARLRRK